MFIQFGPNTPTERRNVLVLDHTVLSFLTDSFDHVKGGDIRHARFFVDTLKTRNQVEFWTDEKHEREGHLELISEPQMLSKDYAGMYTRHLHLEPIGACGRSTSELWLPGNALDVITTSTFGGFGIQYTDVHVENGGHLNPGFTSLRLRGQCYEQQAGTLTMKDLRLDSGADLHFSIGSTQGLHGSRTAAGVHKRTDMYSVQAASQPPGRRVRRRGLPDCPEFLRHDGRPSAPARAGDRGGRGDRRNREERRERMGVSRPSSMR